MSFMILTISTIAGWDGTGWNGMGDDDEDVMDDEMGKEGWGEGSLFLWLLWVPGFHDLHLSHLSAWVMVSMDDTPWSTAGMA